MGTSVLALSVLEHDSLLSVVLLLTVALTVCAMVVLPSPVIESGAPLIDLLRKQARPEQRALACAEAVVGAYVWLLTLCIIASHCSE